MSSRVGRFLNLQRNASPDWAGNTVTVTVDCACGLTEFGLRLTVMLSEFPGMMALRNSSGYA